MSILRLTLIAVVACGGSKTNNIDAPPGGGDGHGNIDAPTPTPDAPAGSNTITGMMNGTNFNTVGASYWIGKPDVPATDTVVYMFDRAVACNQMTAAGWDAALPAGTQILEMKMNGKTPATYASGTNPNPTPGKSYSGYTLAAPTSTDIPASAGLVTLTMLGTPGPSGFGVGTFQLTLPGGSLAGSYDAPYCSTGREP